MLPSLFLPFLCLAAEGLVGEVFEEEDKAERTREHIVKCIEALAAFAANA
ncbi:MAG: hypothetical protein QXR85_02755 [Candidatus Micrarchaeaceae archaeon]